MGNATAKAQHFQKRGIPLPPPPRGCIWLEFIGDPDPMDDVMVQYQITRGMLDPETEEVIREAAAMRTARVDGVTRRGFRRGDLPGLSQDYWWGPKPGTFVQPVTFHDALLILNSNDAFQFRDPNAPESDLLLPQSRRHPTVDAVAKLIGEVKLTDGAVAVTKDQAWNLLRQIRNPDDPGEPDPEED